jgi:hypothetical protein
MLANSAGLIARPESPDGIGVQGSHITTYHLRFVEVPRTYKLDKDAGEATIIELAKENGRVVVTAIR